jgi:hypothetical protein
MRFSSSEGCQQMNELLLKTVYIRVEHSNINPLFHGIHH